MTDEKTPSQESLPLSQESFLQLMHMLNHPNMNDVGETPSTESSDFFEQIRAWGASVEIPVVYQQTEQNAVLASLPGMSSWPGSFSFAVSFSEPNQTKGASWCYSKALNKLYVKRDESCPVNFSTKYLMTSDTFIRATAYYTLASHSSEVVQRCINHGMSEELKGVFEAYHLVRCESNMSNYQVDTLNGRHSVIVPFENPPAGQHFSTYIYKFKCFGSCAGGPNRRPMMILFTLENRDGILGRQRVELKICACPLRDMRLEEKGEGGVKRKLPPSIQTKCSKTKSEVKEPGLYTIKTRDEKCYLFLKQMKKLYDMRSMYNMSSNSSEDSS